METFNCQPLLDQIVKIFTDTGLLNSFVKEDTVEKRIRFCLNTKNIVYGRELTVNVRDKISDLLEAFDQSSQKRGKCEKICKDLKDEGTKEYLQKKLGDAHRLYSEGLRRAPQGSLLIPILYANRSAVLIEMGHYEDCLKDIECAQKTGYPLQLIHKLFIRKATCLIQCGYLDEARKTLQELKLKEEQITISEKQLKTISELEFALTLEDAPKKNISNISLEPLLYKSESEMVGSMSSSLEMRSNEIQGRYVVSLEKVPKGSVVFREKAFASILLPEYALVHCQLCLRKTFTPVPCEICTNIIWCSTRCRDLGNWFHRYECGLFNVLSGIGIAHLSLRVFLKAGLELCRNIISETEEKKIENFNRDTPDEKYRAVYSLLTHLDKVAPPDLLSYAWVAIIMSEALLEKTSYISDMKLFESKLSNSAIDSEVPSPKYELQVEICCILMHHISQLIANAHAITEVSDACDDEADVSCISQKSIACAIYPSVSLMNHSCKPTIINCFDGDSLTIRNIVDLDISDEVFNCYGPHYVNQTRAERQDDLLKQYFFQCKCVACTEDSYIANENEWSGIICDCGGTALWDGCEDASNPIIESDQNLTCMTGCKKSYSPSKELIDRCTEVSTLYDEGLELLNKESLEYSKLKLTKAVVEGAKIYGTGNGFLNTIRDTLAKVLVKKREFEPCFFHLRRCMDCLITRYGKHSIEVAHEMIKVLDIVKLYRKSLLQVASLHDKLVDFADNFECEINRTLTIHYGQQWREFLKIDLKNMNFHACDNCKV